MNETEPEGFSLEFHFHGVDAAFKIEGDLLKVC